MEPPQIIYSSDHILAKPRKVIILTPPLRPSHNPQILHQYWDYRYISVCRAFLFLNVFAGDLSSGPLACTTSPLSLALIHSKESH